MTDLHGRLNGYVDELTPSHVAPLRLESKALSPQRRRRALLPVAVAVAMTVAVLMTFTVVRSERLSTPTDVAASTGDLEGTWNISGIGADYQQPPVPSTDESQSTLEIQSSGRWTATLMCDPGSPVQGTLQSTPDGGLTALPDAVPQACRGDSALDVLTGGQWTPEFVGPTLHLDGDTGSDLLLTPVPGEGEPSAAITDYGNGHGYLSLSVPVGRNCQERISELRQTAADELTATVSLATAQCQGQGVTAQFGHNLRSLPSDSVPTTVHIYVESNEPVDVVAAWSGAGE